MIPKVIHYCWFGKQPLPDLAVKCIESWKKFMPDYEIKEWNESNFNVNIIPYTQEAYEKKKYAFVSDYARFWILYNYGGIYFDTDVEVIKPMTHIIDVGAFLACECSPNITKPTKVIAPGLGIASEPKHPLYKTFLESYHNSHFSIGDSTDQETVVTRVTKILGKYNLSYSTEVENIEGINIYPPEYFCPINCYTGEKNITEHTVSIHHYAASWVDFPWHIKLWRYLHLPNSNIRGKLMNFFKKVSR